MFTGCPQFHEKLSRMRGYGNKTRGKEQKTGLFSWFQDQITKDY